MNTEKLGTASLTLLFAKSGGLLDPNITYNEKNISWDGTVAVYKKRSTRYQKADMPFLVPIQAKAHERANPGTDPGRFDIELDDLRLYEERGGTVYFTVCVDKSGENPFIWYKALLPGDCAALLDEAAKRGNVKYIRVPHDCFPTELSAVEELMTAFAGAMRDEKLGEQKRWADYAPAGRAPCPAPKRQRQKPSSPYLYNAEVIPFVGREKEMDALRGFLEDERLFCWWAVVAPGGAGKTRLVYEFGKRLEQEGVWQYSFLGENGLRELSAMSCEQLRDRLSEPTLLVVDYAQRFAEKLGEWMKLLTAPDFWHDDVPLRLLLLERADKGPDGRCPWERELALHADESRLRAARFAPVRELEALEAAPQESVMRAFAAWLCNMEPELPEPDEAFIGACMESLQAIPEAVGRPLFAMLLVDARLHGEPEPGGSWERLIAYQIEKEKRDLRGRIRDLGKPDQLLEDAAFELLSVASVLGVAGDPGWKTMTELCTEQTAELERAAKEARIPVRELLHRLDRSNAKRDSFSALRPDLFGEYLVLDWLRENRETIEKAERFFGAILSNFDATQTFFLRVLRDYEGMVLVENASNRVKVFADWLFPQGVKLHDDVKTKRIVRLLRNLFDGAPLEENAPVIKNQGYIGAKTVTTRTWLAIRMECYEESMEDKSGCDYAFACGDLAVVYNDMGYDNKAQKYCNEAIKKERNFDKNNTDTALLYNDLASVYHDIGRSKGLRLNINTRNAWKCYKRAVEIWKNAYGPMHQTIVITYCNLSTVYWDAGLDNRSQRYFQKAKAVEEELLDKKAPNTVNMYNALGRICQDMGEDKDAEDYCKKALELQKEGSGLENPETAETYKILAQVFQNKGKYEDAQEFYSKALNIQIKYLGWHVSTAITCEKYGDFYRAWKKFTKAILWLRAALDIVEKELGTMHRYTEKLRNKMEIVEKLNKRRDFGII